MRALRSILEDTLRELMFHLPEHEERGKNFVITAEMIKNGNVHALLKGGESTEQRESA